MYFVLALRSLLELAKTEKLSYPNAADLLERQTYVDDIYGGGDTLRQVIKVRDQLIELLNSDEISLGKWTSSSEKILENLPTSEQKKHNIDFSETVSTLGLKRSPSADKFLFFTSIPKSFSFIIKRIILSETAKLFDPLGWLSSIVIIAKILTQDLWINKIDWDSPLTNNLCDRWLDFKSYFPDISKISIPRWCYTLSGSTIMIHGFSDASVKPYAAVVDLAIPGVGVSLLASKSKVAPVLVQTLPRLELCGALLLAHLVK